MSDEIDYVGYTGQVDILSLSVRKSCKWKKLESIYTTECKETIAFEHGTYQEHNFRYCPFCGKEIIE